MKNISSIINFIERQYNHHCGIRLFEKSVKTEFEKKKF